MHLRSLAALALTLALGVGVAPGATADSPRRTADRAAPSCGTGVVGQSADGRILEHLVRNGRLVSTQRTRRLSVQVTALGFFDVRGKVTRLTATTADGVPRMLTRRSTSATGATVSTRPFAQDGFAPHLFTDAYGYYAYTVDAAGVLRRWVLHRDRDGSFAYVRSLRLGRGLRGLTALGTAGYRAKPAADLLYAVTAKGALRLITVPHARPRARSTKTLLASGYAGVTGVSAGYCEAEGQDVLVAVDPAAGRATWTLVSGLTGPTAVARKRGAVTGEADWSLHAVM